MRGEVHVVGRVHQNVAPERVAVVVGQLRRGAGRRQTGVERQQAVVAGAAQVGRAHQSCAVGRQPRNHQIRAGGRVVGRAVAERGRGAAAPKRALQRPRRSGVVQRARRAQHQQLALVVHHQAVRKIGPGPAQVGGPHPRRRPAHASVELDNGNVNQRGKRRLKRARAGGVAGPKRNAARVQVALRIVSRREAPVVGHRAGVGREHHHRVDGQRPGGVVLAQRETHQLVRQHVAAGHGLAPAAGRGLPGHGGALRHGAHAGAHQQVAGRVHGQAFGSVVAQADGGGVGAGGQLKIVLQVLVGALVHAGLHAGPQAGVVQRAEAAHIGRPAPGIAAQKIAAVLGGGRFGRDGGRPGSLKVQGEGVAAHGLRGRRRAGAGAALVAGLGGPAVGQQGEGQAVGFGKKAAAGQRGHVAGGRVPLAFVLNKLQGVTGRSGVLAALGKCPGGKEQEQRGGEVG